MSAPSTIIQVVPSPRLKRTARRTWLAGGAATLLSTHAGPSPTGDERHSKSRSGQTADSLKESQLAPSQSLPSRPDVTGPNPNSKPPSSSGFDAGPTRRAQCDPLSRRGDRDAVAP